MSELMKSSYAKVESAGMEWRLTGYIYLMISNESIEWYINKVKGVNRVVYDIIQNRPATIEWE
jgi:GMP synthase PP-ATPase subunit